MPLAFWRPAGVNSGAHRDRSHRRVQRSIGDRNRGLLEGPDRDLVRILRGDGQLGDAAAGEIPQRHVERTGGRAERIRDRRQELGGIARGEAPVGLAGAAVDRHLVLAVLMAGDGDIGDLVAIDVPHRDGVDAGAGRYLSSGGLNTGETPSTPRSTSSVAAGPAGSSETTEGIPPLIIELASRGDFMVFFRVPGGKPAPVGGRLERRQT